MIAHLRTSKDITVRTLASRAGISAPFVTRLERGLRAVTPATLMTVARALNPNAADWAKILQAITEDAAERKDAGFLLECIALKQVSFWDAKVESIAAAPQANPTAGDGADFLLTLSDGTTWALEVKTSQVSRKTRARREAALPGGGGRGT